MSPTAQQNQNASIASSIVAPHVEFSSLDADTTRLIHYCRSVLAVYSLIQLASSIAMMVTLQTFWASDLCIKNSAYSTSGSVVCEIGLPLFIFASFGIGLLTVMSGLGLYGALSVRRLFVSVYLSLSLGLVVFLAFALTLVVVMKLRFVEFGIAPLVFLVFSFIPVVTSVLLLRFKSLDKDSQEGSPSYSMMETVLVYPSALARRSEEENAPRSLVLPATGNQGSSIGNDSILFSFARPSHSDGQAGPPAAVPAGSNAAADQASSDAHLLRVPQPVRAADGVPPPRRTKNLDDAEFMSFL